jgi:hypothetical protein
LPSPCCRLLVASCPDGGVAGRRRRRGRGGGRS